MDGVEYLDRTVTADGDLEAEVWSQKCQENLSENPESTYHVDIPVGPDDHGAITTYATSLRRQRFLIIMRGRTKEEIQITSRNFITVKQYPTLHKDEELQQLSSTSGCFVIGNTYLC